MTLGAACIAGSAILMKLAGFTINIMTLLSLSLAVGLLILAIRYSSWWLGAAMLLQGIALSLHAAHFAAVHADESINVLNLYILGKNLASVGMLFAILAGTLANLLRHYLGTRRRDVRLEQRLHIVALQMQRIRAIGNGKSKVALAEIGVAAQHKQLRPLWPDLYGLREEYRASRKICSR